MYEQKQLFEILKKILIFSGRRLSLTQRQRAQMLWELSIILKKIEQDNSSLAENLKRFLTDIISDLEAGREVNIDSISEDELISNYLLAEKYALAWNSILTRHELWEYQKLLQEGNTLEFVDILKKKNKALSKLCKDLETENMGNSLLLMNMFRLAKYQSSLSELIRAWLKLSQQDLLSELLLLSDNYARICHICIAQWNASLNNKRFHREYISVDIKSNKVALEKKALFEKSREKELFLKMCQKYFIG